MVTENEVSGKAYTRAYKRTASRWVVKQFPRHTYRLLLFKQTKMCGMSAIGYGGIPLPILLALLAAETTSTAVSKAGSGNNLNTYAISELCSIEFLCPRVKSANRLDCCGNESLFRKHKYYINLFLCKLPVGLTSLV